MKNITANLAMMLMLPLIFLGGVMAFISLGLGVGWSAMEKWMLAIAEDQTSRRRTRR